MPCKDSRPEPRETTVAEIFASTAARAPDSPFAAWREGGIGDFREVSYAETDRRARALRAAYRGAGYGTGSRIALLTGNRPEFYFHYLALNGLGVSVVPLNPEARPQEALYILEHSEAELVVVSPHCGAAFAAAAAESAAPPPLLDALEETPAPPEARKPRDGRPPERDDEAAVLYTSGTTGRPKGCVLSHRYFVESGHIYAGWDGLLTMEDGKERLLNPLPLFHMNNFAVTSTATIIAAGCNAMLDRFSPSRWWADCRESGATRMHYLGVMPALLLARADGPEERAPKLKIGVGAGVDPKHHRAFETRFGVPLIELWGMTETGRGFVDRTEPRHVGTRAFGRPEGALEARVVDEEMNDVPAGTPGELLVRSNDPNPRRAFFSRYLKDEAATAAAWRDDWFRTGDIVRQDETGMLYFVDRRKNIVRRSGENIAAAEVEACLQTHDAVLQAAILAMPDDLREEEVFACVVLREGCAPDEATARALFGFAYEQLTYFKAPGYICFRDALPTTGTQKIQKGRIFREDENPLALPETFDLRILKRRTHPDAALAHKRREANE